MDILDNFEKYLEDWCNKKRLPNPGKDNINKTWKLAWDDYTKEVLVSKWEDYKIEYLNMELLTNNKKLEMISKKEQETQREIVDSCGKEGEPKISDWEKVRSLLK